MKLKIKRLSFTAGDPFIAVLNKKDAYHLDLYPGDRIKIKYKSKEIIAVVNLAFKNVNQGEIGIFEHIINFFNVTHGYVDVSLSEKLKSTNYIKKKLEGNILNAREINEIVKDIMSNNLSEIELTYFVSACYGNGLNNNEVIALTKAIVNNGNKLNLNKHPILDLHSIGGIPGNRITIIAVPIIAAAGFIIPKTSSRSITSPSGTSDTMEVLANVSFLVNDIKKIVNKTNGCMVWGGAVNLAAADDKLIRVRNPLGLDPEGMLLASIIAKKAAVNATHVLIEIPVGKNSKVENKQKAVRLKNKFIQLGKKFNIKIIIMFSDGNQPVGNGIGPGLEARDVLKVLQGTGPEDLREKGLKTAAMLLKLLNVKDAYTKATEILDSGLAYEKFREIVKAQKGDPNIKIEDIKIGPFSYDVKSKYNGTIAKIDNNIISRIARVAGAPNDKEAGIYLNYHINDYVKKNDILFTIYAKNQKKLRYSLNVLKLNNPIMIR